MTELTRRARKPQAVPLVTAEDFLFLLKLPVLAAAAAFVAETRWDAVALRLERATRWFSRERIARTARGLAICGGRPTPDPMCVLASQTEQSIGVLREYLAGWSPKSR